MAIFTRLKEKVAKAVAVVKEKTAKVVSAMTRGIDKVKLAKATFIAAAMSAMMTVAPVAMINPDGVNIEEIMGSVLGIIFTIAMWVGVVMSVFGLFSLVLAFKNDDADAKSRATQTFIVGASLIGLKTLAGVLLTKIGVTVIMPS